jgi:hypothetical protein
VARAADAALEAIAAASSAWAACVQRLKFEAHNRQWLQLVRQQDLASAAVEVEGLATGLANGQGGGGGVSPGNPFWVVQSHSPLAAA